LIFKVSI